MSATPNDLDRMMWQIAERGDARAAADFSQRFPDLAPSMTARMKMVSGMRSMRSSIAPAVIPPFSPRFLFRPVPKWKRFGPSAVGLFALAAASFYITQNLVTPLPEAEIFREAPAASRPDPAPSDAAQPDAPAPYRAVDADGPKPYESSAKEEKPDLRLTGQGVPLQKVLQQIAAQEKLTLEIPSEMPNPPIDVDMRGKTGVELLQQLGAQHGFSAFDEGHGHVLIVPAVDGQADTPH